MLAVQHAVRKSGPDPLILNPVRGGDDVKAILVQEAGPADVLRPAEIEEPAPGAGEALVAVEVVGVPFGDTIVRSGRYPTTFPYVPGIEVGGRIAAVGPGVDKFLLGRRVVATTVGNVGGYAELARVNVADVVDVPAGLPLEQAVAVFQAGALAIGLLGAMRVGADDSLLVTAAAGRVGSLLTQLAAATTSSGSGLVIGAARGPDKLAAITQDGAAMAVDYSHDRWVEQVRSATAGTGADIVLDAVGGVIGAQALEATAAGHGRLGIYGYSSGAWPRFDIGQLARRGITVTGPLGIMWARPLAEQRQDPGLALNAAATGRLVPRIWRSYPLTDAARAHTDLETRTSTGAVVLHL
jgi:NADPH:quinone reductase